MDQLQLDEELGKGNYGTVKKVLHKPTNVAMAMKVGHHLFPVLLLTTIFFRPTSGNTPRTRRCQTKCNNNGTRHPPPRRRP
jgi:hypothetical protein